MNHVILRGRLVADQEVRYTNAGKAVASFRLAVDSGYGDSKRTAFINCVAWEKTAEQIGNTLGKGRRIIVSDGEWQTRSYENKEGKKVQVNECLVRKFEYDDAKPSGQSQDGDNGYGFGPSVPDESIPF